MEQSDGLVYASARRRRKFSPGSVGQFKYQGYTSYTSYTSYTDHYHLHRHPATTHNTNHRTFRLKQHFITQDAKY
jgi:hypothetical protein